MNKIKPRRLRRGERIRNLVADVSINIDNFIFPLFIKDGDQEKISVPSMPGIFQMSADVAVNEIKELSQKGIKNFLLFGVIDSNKKDLEGSYALDPSNPVNTLSREIKEHALDVLVTTDLCYCEYTDHGHCGIVSNCSKDTLDNEKSLEIIAKQAITLASNGADIIAPSGMLDGSVATIRQALDSEGHNNIPIMSYSTKFASSLYGPFRDAAHGAPSFGDRKSYQMDFKRSDEWILENALDQEQGADMLMVKPASFYLDIITNLKSISQVPIGAYQVSGEYSMIHAAAANDYLDLKTTALESLYCIKRAGADFIICYFTKDLPDWLE